MFKNDLRAEIIALNLKDIESSEVKVVYVVFPPKENRKFTNCVMEVIRSQLLNEKHVFINSQPAGSLTTSRVDVRFM